MRINQRDRQDGISTSTRRQFLTRGGAALAGGLASCNSIDRADPKSLNSYRGLRVDAHAHIFNGEDVDGYGYLAQELRPHTTADTLLMPIRLLVHLIDIMAKWAGPGMKLEHHVLDEMLNRRADRLKKNPELLLTHTLDQRRAHAKMLERDIREICWSGTHESLDQEARREHLSRIKEVATELKVDTSLPLTAFEAGQMHLGLGGKGSPHYLAWCQTHLSLEDWLSGFISSMCNFRVYNAVRMLQRYPDIHVFVASTLDPDEWFRYRRHGNLKNPSEPISEQAEAMAKITVVTEGRVLQRTGWCPLRQARMDNPILKSAADRQFGRRENQIPASPTDVLKMACERHGSLGAKLYPVLGFRGWNNAELTNKEFGDVAKGLGEEQGHLMGQQLDASMTKLYDMCTNLGCTIMAHTSFSFGGGKPEMERANPSNWKEVVRRYKRLGLSLGHFGGFEKGAHGNSQHSDVHEGPGDWPLQIAAMMSDDNRLFADLSYVTAKDPKWRKEQLDLVAKNSHQDNAGRRLLQRRLLYGTDWHELLSSTESYSYYRDWTRLFENNELRTWAPGFFGGNAVDFLGLRRPSKTRARLDRFFDLHKVSPAWTSIVDGGVTMT